MRAKATVPDDYFLADDDHEQVLIAAPRKPEQLLYRFMSAGHGLNNDAFVRPNLEAHTRNLTPWLVDVKGYNPTWQRAVRIEADAWNAEIRIPWTAQDYQPKTGDSLRINLGRFRSQGLNWERSYWSPVLEMHGDTLEKLDVALLGTVLLK